MLPFVSSKITQRRTDIFRIWGRKRKDYDPNAPASIPSPKKPIKNIETVSLPVKDIEVSAEIKTTADPQVEIETSLDIPKKITSKKGPPKKKSKPEPVTQTLVPNDQYLPDSNAEITENNTSPKLEIKPVDNFKVTPSTAKKNKSKPAKASKKTTPTSTLPSQDSIDIDDEVALLSRQLSGESDVDNLGIDDTFNIGLLEDDFDLRDTLGELGIPNLDDDFAKLEATLNWDDFIFADTIKQPGTTTDGADSFTNDFIPSRSTRNGTPSPVSILNRETDNIGDFLQMDDVNVYKKRDKSVEKLKIKRAQDSFDQFDDEDEDEEEKSDEVLESDLEEVLGLGEILDRSSELDDEDRERFEDEEDILSFVLDDDRSLADDDDDDDEEDEDDDDDDERPISKTSLKPSAAIIKSSPIPPIKSKSKSKPTVSMKDMDIDVDELELELDGFIPDEKDDESALVVGGVELDKKEFALGQVPPPLEEFRRLMEALGGDADSMFGSDEYETNRASTAALKRRRSSAASKESNIDEESDVDEEDKDSYTKLRKVEIDLTNPEVVPWLPDIYSGGVPNESVFVSERTKSTKRPKEVESEDEDESNDDSYLHAYPAQLNKDPPPFSPSFFAEAYNELNRPIIDEDDDILSLSETDEKKAPKQSSTGSTSKKGSKKVVTSHVAIPAPKIIDEESHVVIEGAKEEGVDFEDDSYSEDDEDDDVHSGDDIFFDDTLYYGHTEISSENIADSTDMTSLEWWAGIDDRPTDWRLLIVSVVTNSTKNNTALSLVETVLDYIKEKTDNDPRINYQTIVYAGENENTPVKELEDNIQMWCEGYNTYHLIDGAAMKEVWGGIMPDIILSPKNLNAVVEQVTWALEEDDLDGVLLTPRLRRLRLRGGAQEMIMGFNTEFLDSEFSVVSVR